MNSKEGQPSETESQEKYEATVLDFLDREMATVQATQKKNQQSDELDALVSDLLKQVITEADQKETPEDRPLFDEDELFDELKSGQKGISASSDTYALKEEPASAATQSALAQTASLPEVEHAPAPQEPEPESKVKALASSTVFSSGGITPQKKSPVIIAAAAGILVIVGVAGYYFSGSSTKTSVHAGPSEVTQAYQQAPMPVPSPRVTAGQPAKSAAPAVQKQAAAPVVPVKKAANQTPVPQPAKPVAGTAKMEAPKQTPTPAKVAEEVPVVAQPVPVSPVPSQIAAVVERPAVSAPAEHAPAAPERKPAPPATASVSEQPSAAEPQPAPAAPAFNKLVAAVPLQQASPVFPEVALRAKASGSVVLELQIDDQGKVIKATPVSGPAIFYNSAVAAVMKWRYKPASIGGVNVSSQSRVTMAFNMKK